jgi:hypothetical protein
MIYADVLRLDADVLLRETIEFTKQERWVTARLLVRLAAVEKRELYAPLGYSSMWEYCLSELGMSEDAAGRRLWAARKCRDFPALFDALADSCINLTAIHTLAAYLKPDNVDALIAAATGRSKAQLLDWLACRFPRAAVPTVIRPVDAPAPATSPLFTPAPPTCTPAASVSGMLQPAPSEAEPPLNETPQPRAAEREQDLHALARVPVPSTAPISPTSQVPLRDRAQVDPLNAEQVKVQFTMSRQALAKMQQAQDLLGHQVPRNDIAALFEKLLDMAIPTLEKKKFAATHRPRAAREQKSTSARTIPAHVQREVWKRDGGRRCACTRGLEYDHVKPVALGGEATIENVRILCRKHNQLEAERRLGASFMRAKRATAKRRRSDAA